MARAPGHTRDTFGGINVPEGGRVVVNPISGSVYIESDPIQILNPVTFEKLRGPGALGKVIFCPASNRGYVVGRSLSVIDAAADTVISTEALPFECYALAYSSTSNRLYIVVDFGAGSS